MTRFYDEISLVAKASKVSVPLLLSERKKLDIDLKTVLRESQSPATPACEMFPTLSNHFASEVQIGIQALTNELDRLEQSVRFVVVVLFCLIVD